MTIAMQQGVTESLTCHRICEETITHCLRTGGAHSDSDQIRLLMDCADICETCAIACERFHDDAQMVSCAQACRRCATACRQMANAR